MRKAILLKTLNEPSGEPYKITFQSELQDWTYPNRRRGAPKHTWARKALEALWEEARRGRQEWRSVELNRNREDVKNSLKEDAAEEYNRLEKEKGRKGEWEKGWEINDEIEKVRSGTIVEHGRRMAGNFLREIWGEDERENRGKGKGKGNQQRGRWISGGFLRTTERGVEREGEHL